MSEEWKPLLLLLPVGVIFAAFVWGSWNDARHHHKWGKWGEPKIVSVMVEGVERGQAKFQERYCETCGEGAARRMT